MHLTHFACGILTREYWKAFRCWLAENYGEPMAERITAAVRRAKKAKVRDET